MLLNTVSVELLGGAPVWEHHKQISRIISHLLTFLMEIYFALICCLIVSWGNLHRNVPHRLRYLNTFQWVVLFREMVGLLVEGRHWELALRLHSLAALPVSSASRFWLTMWSLSFLFLPWCLSLAAISPFRDRLWIPTTTKVNSAF